jgi:midasin (ATPase involved in ribosome maturation)
MEPNYSRETGTNFQSTFCSSCCIEQNLIPEKDDTFVKFGNFNDVKKIIQSRLFYPTFITGLSGNGKTFSVEQACAQLKRELIRVNITIETDEDDLIGGFRLVDGKLHGITVPSSKHSNVEQSFFSMSGSCI